jgi:hypothetical protein
MARATQVVVSGCAVRSGRIDWLSPDQIRLFERAGLTQFLKLNGDLETIVRLDLLNNPLLLLPVDLARTSTGAAHLCLQSHPQTALLVPGPLGPQPMLPGTPGSAGTELGLAGVAFWLSWARIFT